MQCSGGFRPIAPRCCCLGNPGSTLLSQPALVPARSQRLETAFHSPATTALFREPPSRGQRSWPIPSAEFRTLLSTRSILHSHPRRRSSRRRGSSSHKTRCRFRSSELSDVHPAAAPLQDFGSLRDRRVNQRYNPRSLPLRPARSSFAPRKCQLLWITKHSRIVVPDSLPFTRLTAL